MHGDNKHKINNLARIDNILFSCSLWYVKGPYPVARIMAPSMCVNYSGLTSSTGWIHLQVTTAVVGILLNYELVLKRDRGILYERASFITGQTLFVDGGGRIGRLI